MRADMHMHISTDMRRACVTQGWKATCADHLITSGQLTRLYAQRRFFFKKKGNLRPPLGPRACGVESRAGGMEVKHLFLFRVKQGAPFCFSGEQAMSLRGMSGGSGTDPASTR